MAAHMRLALNMVDEFEKQDAEVQFERTKSGSGCDHDPYRDSSVGKSQRSAH
jgi:hypothetical protein